MAGGWLSRLVMTPEPWEEKIVIGPEYAAEILKDWNDENRTMSHGLAKTFAGLMTTGEWDAWVSGPLLFDWDNQLMDGQHRLRALVLSGMSFRFTVIRGLDPALREKLGLARPRGRGDLLATRGVPNAALKAAIVNFAHNVEHGILTDQRNAPPFYAYRRVLAGIHGGRGEPGTSGEDFVDAANVGTLLNSVTPLVPSVCGAFRLWTVKIDPALSNRFFAEVRHGGPGIDVSTPSPTAALKSYLDRLGRASGRGSPLSGDRPTRLTRAQGLYLLCQAWDAFVNGRPLSRVALPPQGNVTYASLKRIWPEQTKQAS